MANDVPNCVILVNPYPTTSEPVLLQNDVFSFGGQGNVSFWAHLALPHAVLFNMYVRKFAPGWWETQVNKINDVMMQINFIDCVPNIAGICEMVEGCKIRTKTEGTYEFRLFIIFNFWKGLFGRYMSSLMSRIPSFAHPHLIKEHKVRHHHPESKAPITSYLSTFSLFALSVQLLIRLRAAPV